MYDFLGIVYRPQRFLFKFRRKDEPHAYFEHASLLHQIPPPRPEGASRTRWIMETLYVVMFYLYYSVCCFCIPPLESTPTSECETLASYFARVRLPEYFAQNYVVPLISSVATCSHEALMRSPAADLVYYKQRTHKKSHFVVNGGVHTVQSRLSKGLAIQLGAYVTSVVSCRSEGKDYVRLEWASAINGSLSVNPQETQSEIFDFAVLAVSPDVVRSVYPLLARHMSRIPTVTVTSNVCSYIDQARLSRGRKSAEIIHLLSDRDVTEAIHEHETAGISVHTSPSLPSLQQGQTPIHRAQFTRVLRTPTSRQIVNDIFVQPAVTSYPTSEKPLLQPDTWRNGDGNVYLAGSWCWDGMVLLEGCVVSAIRVADALGVGIPWR